jgi:hypothetical protein
MVKKYLAFSLIIAILLTFLLSCAGVVYVPNPPPGPKNEVKPPRLGPKAVWIDGHWHWSGGQWVWISGYWVKNPKGQWVAGHWQNTPHGWKWTKGHWKR